MNKEDIIYLDYNATTPVDSRVAECMMPYFTESFANASSFSHALGRSNEEAVDKARGQIAQLIGAESKDIIFTSGATESINLSLLGAARFYKDRGKHILTSSIEHKAVIESCDFLRNEGFQIDILPVDKLGFVNKALLKKFFRPDTILASFQYGNNEIGTLEDIAEIGRLCKENKTIFHVDAAQSFGKIPIDVNEMGIDLMSMSAHKMYGPKGVGGLYLRRKDPRVRLAPLMFGGSQERGHRPGTLNVPGIVGFGAAAALASSAMEASQQYLVLLKEHFKTELSANLEAVEFNGVSNSCLPNTLSVTFEGVDARRLLCDLPGLALSAGSACSSAFSEPSHVLKAIGVSGKKAMSTIRVSFGRPTTKSDVNKALQQIIEKVKELRQKGNKKS